MDIQIRTVPGQGAWSGWEILVDGQVVRDELTVYGNPDRLHVTLWDGPISQTIAATPLRDLPAEVTEWEVYFESEDVPSISSGTVHPLTRRVEYEFQFDLEGWKGAWSIGEYGEEIERVVRDRGDEALTTERTEDESIVAGLAVFVSGLSLDSTVDDAVFDFFDLVADIHDEAERRLESAVRTDAVTLHFDFPPEVKVACEQYLLYFGDFLRDLGVDADTQLRETAGRVLFEVKPTDSADALSKIHDALTTYLRLPASPLQYDDDAELAIQRLVANVHHLRGQLSLAAAIAQSQRATLEAQSETIRMQRQILTGEILMDSLRTSDREEVLGGTMAITKYAGKGFEVDLPEIFRRLRAFIKREAG